MRIERSKIAITKNVVVVAHYMDNHDVVLLAVTVAEQDCSLQHRLFVDQSVWFPSHGPEKKIHADNQRCMSCTPHT